jgi:type IV pilus assembly protein PilO
VDQEKLKELLNRIPVGLLASLYMGYLGYEYYSFTADDTSELVQRQQEVARTQQEVKTLEAKLKQGQEFLKNLDNKKVQLRELASKLDEMKGTLTNEIDVAAFVKLAITEAKKVGLNVLGLRPEGRNAKEFYEEQIFTMGFRGVYVQLVVFLERMASVQNIVRVDSFDLKPRGSQTAEHVEIEGTVELKAYRYLASKADDIGRQGDSKSGGATAPGGQAGQSGAKKPGGGE